MVRKSSDRDQGAAGSRLCRAPACRLRTDPSRLRSRSQGRFEIEFGANGISRGGVVFAQLKLGIRAVSSPGAPDE